jgi:hypothetical protein
VERTGLPSGPWQKKLAAQKESSDRSSRSKRLEQLELFERMERLPMRNNAG